MSVNLKLLPPSSLEIWRGTGLSHFSASLAHFLPPCWLRSRCSKAGRGKSSLGWVVGLWAGVSPGVADSSAAAVLRGAFSWFSFLGHWGSRTCCSLADHTFSSYSGFLPPPLQWGHCIPLGVPWTGFLLKLHKSAPFLENHTRPTGTQEHRVQAVPDAAFRLLSSQGAGHLQCL